MITFKLDSSVMKEAANLDFLSNGMDLSKLGFKIEDKKYPLLTQDVRIPHLSLRR